MRPLLDLSDFPTRSPIRRPVALPAIILQNDGMEFSGEATLDLVQQQVDLGIRAPGTPGHEALVALLQQRLADLDLEVGLQRWQVPLSLAPGGQASLTNVLVRLPGRKPGPTTLLSTHYDTRWIADNEQAPALRHSPIPGANDGGSGTAVQLELARALRARPPRHDVVLGFMDGEDLGDIEGHAFAAGSEKMASDPGEFCPDEVIALDMVGGRDMRLNVDLNSLYNSERAREIFSELFRLGRAMGLDPFSGGTVKIIRSDHYPWIQAGVPAVLLIDIDYPFWHTHGDLPGACSASSLEAVGRVLLEYLG